jgi:hypothetical protein
MKKGIVVIYIMVVFAIALEVVVGYFGTTSVSGKSLGIFTVVNEGQSCTKAYCYERIHDEELDITCYSKAYSLFCFPDDEIGR